MGLRIPKNQTVESKYTSGGEYMFASTQNEYKGYYYEVNNKTFAGKELNTTNPEIIKIQSDRYNTLLGNAATYVYGVISKVKLINTKPKPIQYNQDNPRNTLRYFAKKTNENIIREIDEDNFKQIQSNPIYVSLSLFFRNNGFDQNELNEAEKKMPGIKEYTNTTYVPGATD